MTKVLVVDDDAALVKALRIGLTARGDEVATAQSERDGITQVALFSPDLVILDLGLPDLDGLEVCRRIREFSDVPVVVLSAYGDERRKVEALDGGADDFITKPFGMAELEARLRVAVRHSAARTGNGADPSATLRVGDLEIDMVHHMATRGGLCHRLDQSRVRPVGLPGSLCRQGVHAPHDPQGRLGPRLRGGVQLRARLHPPAAQEAATTTRGDSCAPFPASGTNWWPTPPPTARNA